MTLMTHAIVGAAVASLFPQQPVIAFCGAFVSHFLIDAIPHADYAIASDSIKPHIGAPMKLNHALIKDMYTIGSDALLGIILSVVFFATPTTLWIILGGACAGILPDPLQFVYGHWKHEPLITLQRFHKWIHTKHRMKETPWLGFFSQAAFVSMVVICTKLWF